MGNVSPLVEGEYVPSVKWMVTGANSEPATDTIAFPMVKNGLSILPSLNSSSPKSGSTYVSSLLRQLLLL